MSLRCRVWGLGLVFFWLKILEKGFCGCLKWLGYQESIRVFTSFGSR